jgi:hypothetical protein
MRYEVNSNPRYPPRVYFPAPSKYAMGETILHSVHEMVNDSLVEHSFPDGHKFDIFWNRAHFLLYNNDSANHPDQSVTNYFWWYFLSLQTFGEPKETEGTES